MTEPPNNLSSNASAPVADATTDGSEYIAQPESGGFRSVALSVVIHVSLLVALALVWTSRSIGGGTDEGPRRVAIVLASAENDSEYFDEADMQEADANEAESALESALPQEESPIDVSQLVNEIPALDLPLPGMNSSEMTNIQNQAEVADSKLTDAEQKALAAESAAFAAKRPKGPPTSLRVFGSGELTGRKFVFVLDRSKSMGAAGLNVLAAASKELSTAISSLEPYHQFQILAYHHDTVAIDQRSLINATNEKKAEVATFVHNLAAFGGTEHQRALGTALSMDPDVVILLTDGGLPELNESQLNMINRMADGIQIHCIQFGSGPQASKNNFMSRLANQNLGTFRYVDVSKWNDP